MNEKKYVLGTVQLGLNYGINNQVGKPSREAAYAILNTAMKNGIKELDTAAGYGDSEAIIGEFHKDTGKQFAVCTKLILEKGVEVKIEQIVDAMLMRLAVSKIKVLYLHRFEQAKNPFIMEQLAEMKMQGKVKKIGISIYAPDELEYIVQNLSDTVDVVQIPYNILDHERWDALIEKSHRKQIEIYARSVFLQGLLFKNVEDAVVKRLSAQNQIRFVNELACAKNVSIAKLLIDFCRKSKADAILLGCESKKQLLDNIMLLTQENCLNDKDMDFIRSQIKGVSAKIIDPRKWQ